MARTVCRTRSMLVWVAVVCGGTAAVGQSDDVRSAKSLQEVISADDSWEAAVAAVNAGDMDRFMAADYQNFRAQGGQNPTQTKAQWLAFYRSGATRPTKPENKKIEERIVRVYGDTAMVMSRIAFTDTVNGRQVANRLRVMHLWQRRAGKWLLVADMFYPASPPPVDRRVSSVSADTLKQSTGNYDIPEQGAKLHIAVSGDHLRVSVESGGQFDLLPESDSTFFTKDGEEVCTFVRNGQGRVTHAILEIAGRTYRALKGE